MTCSGYPDPVYLVISNQVPGLLYYSHIPTVAVGLFFGLFVYFKDRNSLLSKLLLSISFTFFFWVFCDLVAWTNNKSNPIMFVWSLLSIFYSLLYFLSFYFVYVFIKKKDLPLLMKMTLAILLLPVFVLAPTKYNLSGFNLALCGAAGFEGVYFTNYYYLLGLSLFFWMIFLAVIEYRRASDNSQKRQIFWLLFGMGMFLLSFFSASFLASVLVWMNISHDYTLTQYGLFGMPVFMGFLAYLIVRYQAFNIRIIATQALVVTLAILIGSQLFFIRSQINFILTSITFLLSVLFGILLIRSVKNEIRRKEELQIVTDKLAAANVELKRLDQSKTEFISIASHQLRTPLTAIKGFVSLLLEGSYGTVPAPIADVLDKIYTANDRIVHLVEDLLNISRMESGRLKYEYAEVNIPEFLNELRDTFALVAKKKGLDLTFEVPAGALAPAWIDRQKAFEVVSNLIDNAIKYTSAGSVRVRAEGMPGFVRISVADTGVGIDPDMMPVLFQKFSRGKESGKMHVSGTGLGLYVGKSMIEAQGGHIGVTSEGAGKGSTFFVELPVKQG